MVGYTNWGQRSQNSDNSNEDCVILNGTHWEGMDCNSGDVAKTICEERVVDYCPDDPGWQVIHGRCFYFSQSATGYENANNDCIEKGGRLFEPKNANAYTQVHRYYLYPPIMGAAGLKY